MTATSFMMRKRCFSSTMGKVREIVVEMMGVLKSGLPEPELKIVNDEKLEWVGHTDWNYGIQNGTTFADPTTAISIQKKALVDDRTLRRIVAHELCHHEEFLVIEAGKLSKLGFEKYEQQKETDTHGTEWKKIAARFNAKYGEDFVTEESDKDFVVAKTASPDFGYSQYNDRDKDIAKLTWEVIPNSYHGGFEMYVHDPSIPGPEKGGSFDNVVGQMFCFEFFPNDPSDKSPEKNIAIDSVNIQDPWFGTGLGQMLYDRAIAEAKKEGYDRFWSDKTRSASAESAWSKLKTRYPVRQAYTKWMDTPRRRYVIDLDQPWSKAKAAAITCVACECGDCFLHTASVDVAKLRNLLNLKQRIPVEEIFYHPYTSSRWIRDAFNDHGDVEVQNVDVSKVVPGQRWIFTSEVKKHLKENGELPSVIKRDGLYYMWDGHHKTVARMLEGHDHVEMEVADWLDMGKIATPQAKDQAAPAPGSKPIPPRTVRLWHYTREENLDAIRQQGLLRSKGRGDDLSGGGPSAGVWASSNVPSTSDLRSRPYIEFWAKPEQISHNANYPDSWKLNKSTKEYEKKSEIDQEMLDEWAQGYRHVIMNGDVPVDQILAIHEPWMDEARYLMDNWDRPDCEWLHDPKEVEKFKKDNMPSEARALAYVQKVKGTDVPKTAAVSKPEKISTKDVPEALEVAAVCFPQFVDVVEPIVREALGNNFDMSYVTKDEGKIVGGYFLANNPLPADVKGAEQYQGKKGIEGVALFVLPEYRGKGTGHALRDLPLHLGADYIWGQHFEELNNLQPWINFGRKHMDTIDGVHITLMDFHKTASAVRYFWPDSEDDEEDTGDTCSFYTQAYTLAKDSGLNILRDKDPACYALDGERVVGCLFVTDSNQKFSFDIAVDPKFRNKGIGTKLIDMGIQEYEQRKEAFDDYSYSLDVINPSMKKILERKGFQVDEDLGNRWVMSKTADAKSEDESVGRIKQQLEAIKGIRGELPKHIKYSLESFILEFGKHYYTDKNSFKGKRGVQKQCYMNAYKLMMDNPNLTYVEGHVDIGPMSVEHAWCVTKAGIVIDPTLPPPVETQTVRPQGYFGVPFSSEYVMETASKTGVYGILSYTNRNLFSGKIEPEDFLSKTATAAIPPILSEATEFYVNNYASKRDIGHGDKLLNILKSHDFSKGQCHTVSEDFARWAKSNYPSAGTFKVISGEMADSTTDSPSFHFAVQAGSWVVDLTRRQFDPSAPIITIIPLSQWKREFPKELKTSKTASENHEYGCIMADVPEDSSAAAFANQLRDSILDEDLIGDGKNVGHNHITLRYGMIGNDSRIKEYLETLAPIEVGCGATISFDPSKSSKGAAPIVMPCGLKGLKPIYDKLGTIGVWKQSDFEYAPHIMVAFVKPEAAEKYVGQRVRSPETFTLRRIEIRDSEDKSVWVELGESKFASRLINRRH